VGCSTNDESSTFLTLRKILRARENTGQIRVMAHYIGLDIGTGSARACLVDEKGDLLRVAVKDIRTWHEKADYYVNHRASYD